MQLLVAQGQCFAAMELWTTHTLICDKYVKLKRQVVAPMNRLLLLAQRHHQ
jgi:hypothetical protein